LELASGVLVPIPFVESCIDGITTINPQEGLREALLSDTSNDEE